MDMQPSNSHSVTIDMSWQEALSLILKAVQQECIRLENQAEHLRLQHHPDFNMDWAYKKALADKEALQNAYVVITRGY